MMRVRNWDKWQSYRSDRSQPPWIKVHRRLMRNQEWVSLTDAQRGQLLSIWMLAADNCGKIPDCPKMIRKLTYMDKEPDLQLFVEYGFLEDDAKMTPERRQDDAKMTHQTRLDKTRLEETRQDKTAADAAAVLEYLNQKTGRGFREARNIEACIRREKCSVQDCKDVIDHKLKEWGGTDMIKHVNAKTPWRASHFRDYLDESRAGGPRIASEQLSIDRSVLGNLEFEIAEGGREGALEWIGRQPKEIQGPLTARLERMG